MVIILLPFAGLDAGEDHASRIIELVVIEPRVKLANRMGYSHGGLQSSMGVHNATDGICKGFKVFFRHGSFRLKGEGDNGDRTGQKEEEVKGFV